MKEIFLTEEQYKNLPYKTTIVTKGKSLGHVIGMLEDHGVVNYRWTKVDRVDLLEFPLKIEKNGVEYPFKVSMTVPRLMYPMKPKGSRSRSSPKTMTYLENISWRIFHWYLKSKLDAISYGISDVLEEFMYHVNHELPDGSSISLGEMIMDNVNNLDKITSLPDKSEEPRRVIEIE